MQDYTSACAAYSISMNKYIASPSECLYENAKGDTETTPFTAVSLMHVKLRWLKSTVHLLHIGDVIFQLASLKLIGEKLSDSFAVFVKSYVSLNGLRNITEPLVYIAEDQNVTTQK